MMVNSSQGAQKSVPNLFWVLNILILEKLPELLNHLIESILPQDLIHILINENSISNRIQRSYSCSSSAQEHM